MPPLKKILKDPAIWTLLGLNIFFIYAYKDDPSQYTTIVWLYWCQSVLIGIFNFIDMLTMPLSSVDVKNVKLGSRPATPKQAKGCFPLFFLVHYGIFHLVYFLFLISDFKLADTNFNYMKWALGIMLLQQVIHFTQVKIKYAKIPRNIGSVFFTPYLRIVPMHLTILIPKFLGFAPALTFLVLKTVFDIIGQLITTPYYWNKEASKPEGYI